MNTINNTIRASHPLAPVVPLKVAQVTYASNFTCAAYASGQFSYTLPACTRETTGFFAFTYLRILGIGSRLLMNTINNTVIASHPWRPLFLSKLHKFPMYRTSLVQRMYLANVLIHCCQHAREKQRFYFGFGILKHLRIRDFRPLWLMPRLLINTINTANNTVNPSPLVPAVFLKVAQALFFFLCSVFVWQITLIHFASIQEKSSGFLL